MRKVYVTEDVSTVDKINTAMSDIAYPIDTYSYNTGLEFTNNTIRLIRVENVPFRKYNQKLQNLRDPE